MQSMDRQIKVSDCIDLIVQESGVKRIWLLSQRKSRAIVRPRQVVMWLAREATGATMPQIARILGDRDHTTILHGIRKIDQLRASDPAMKAMTDNLLARLS